MIVGDDQLRPVQAAVFELHQELAPMAIGKAGSAIGLALTPSKTANNQQDSIRYFFHGTDAASAAALLTGAPLSVDTALALHIDGNPGFYLADNFAAAEFFAVRAGTAIGRGRESSVVGFGMTAQSLVALLESGATFGPIPQGALIRPLPGNELFIPPMAFPTFDTLRGAGSIWAFPAIDPELP